MSAPTSHDPVAVNTRDDRCWVRRGWSPAGHGLYALEGSAQDAEQTLYLIGDLAAFGLRSMTHSALPVPAVAERPDGITRRLAPTQALREDDEFHLRHIYRIGRDLPGRDDPARCLKAHPFSPRDGWRMVCGSCDHSRDAGCHQTGGA